MAMKKSKLTIIFAILALAILNIWRWWPDPAASEQQAVYEKEKLSSHISELQLRSNDQPLETNDIVKRNIFSRVADKRKNKAKKAVATKKIKTPKPIVKKDDEKSKISKLSIDKKIAKAELGKFNLIGLMQRDGEIQAFLMNGANIFTVTDGDLIDEKYLISVNSISELELKDKSTKVVRKLSLNKE